MQPGKIYSQPAKQKRSIIGGYWSTCHVLQLTGLVRKHVIECYIPRDICNEQQSVYQYR